MLFFRKKIERLESELRYLSAEIDNLKKAVNCLNGRHSWGVSTRNGKPEIYCQNCFVCQKDLDTKTN